GARVVQRQAVEAQLHAPPLADAAHDAVDEREGLETEEVELDEPDRLGVGEGVLGDDRTVLVHPEGYVVGERAVRDDDPGRMLGGMTQEALEAQRQVEETPLALPRVAQLAQPRLHLERLLEGEVLSLP